MRAKSGGRVKGTPNRSTVAGRAFAEQLVNDPVYRENLRERLFAGRVHPGVEQMLWYYAHGKPKEQLELSGSVSTRDVSTMSDAELLAELEAHYVATAAFLASHSQAEH
jgi:hypothetical protein